MYLCGYGPHVLEATRTRRLLGMGSPDCSVFRLLPTLGEAVSRFESQVSFNQVILTKLLHSTVFSAVLAAKQVSSSTAAMSRFVPLLGQHNTTQYNTTQYKHTLAEILGMSAPHYTVRWSRCANHAARNLTLRKTRISAANTP